MPSNERKYFHEISQEEISKIVQSKLTEDEIKAAYRAPDWCSLGDGAFETLFGCFSLRDSRPDGLRQYIGKEFCNMCVYYRPESNSIK